MITAKKTKDSNTNKEVLYLNCNGKALAFNSFMEARNWQHCQIFGKDANFTLLPETELDYLECLFCLTDDTKHHLIVGDPCRIQHLNKILEMLGLSKNIEDYLVEPQY